MQRRKHGVAHYKGASGGVATAGGAKTIKRRMDMKDLRNILLFLLTVSLLTACTQDEVADSTLLPDGQYPLTFSADGISVSASTRSTVKGNWVGAGTVAVQIGSVVKEYTVAANASDNTKATLSSTAPFYWQKDDEVKNVTAWHPYNNGTLAEWTVAGNQSAGISSYDLIYAQGNIKFTDEPKSLTFHHQTAKIVVNIINNPFVAANQVNSLTIGDASNQVVALSGTLNTGGDTADGVLTADATSKNYITPYDVAPATATYVKSYQALVIPQTFAVGQKLFAINVNGYDTFYYLVPTGGITWKAGNEYTYDITVTPTGLKVATEVSIGWTDSGTSSSGSVTTYTSHKAVGSGTAEDPYKISNAVQLKSLAGANADDLGKCYELTGDIDLSAYNWSPIGGSATTDWTRSNPFTGTFDGQGHTITGLTFASNDADKLYYFGLFNSIGTIGKVKNLIVKDCNINATGIYTYIGAIASQNSGVIENCHVVGGHITLSARLAYCGGIVADGDVYQKNSIFVVACSNSATINCTLGEYCGSIGGLVGSPAYTKIYSSYNAGPITIVCDDDWALRLGGICSNSGITQVYGCYFTEGENNGLGTKINDWSQTIVDAMNTTLTSNGYTNYKWEWSGNTNEAPTVVINN